MGRVLGATRVTGYAFGENDLAYIAQASPKTLRFLRDVRAKEPGGENDYYFRYYGRYYADLYRTLEHLVRFLKPDGRIYVVTQDNVHRGELNRSGEFLSQFFRRRGFETTVPLPRAIPPGAPKRLSALSTGVEKAP